MSNEHIEINAAQTARLDHGAKTEDFDFIQDAINAFEKLPPEKKEIATIS